MDILAFLYFGLMLSGVAAILIASVRGIISIYRSVGAKKIRNAIYAFLIVLFLTALLFAILGAWFAYGVAHTAKDASTDAINLAVTLLPAYLGSYFSWRLYLKLESSSITRSGK